MDTVHRLDMIGSIVGKTTGRVFDQNKLVYTSCIVCYRLDECVPVYRFLLKSDIYLKQCSDLFFFLALTQLLFFIYL